MHCLSSSGRRDPRELSTAECKAVIDELERMQVFYVNIGGGEPTVRPDFWELVDYATAHHVGVKFSTNGVKIDPEVARRLAASDYVDVQISLDGATAEVNDAVRGAGSFATAMRAMQNLAEAGFAGFKISVVVTRQNVGQLDAVQGDRRPFRRAAAADPVASVRAGRRRVGRAAPDRRAAADALRLAGGERRAGADRRLVLPPGRVRRGAARPEPVRGRPGRLPHRSGRRRVRLPVRDPREFLAGNIRGEGGFAKVWRESELFLELRRPQTGGACQSCQRFDSCRGGCMAAKFFTGLPLDGPDPECVQGYGSAALAAVSGAAPKPSVDHSHRKVPVTIGRRRPPSKDCDENPLAGFTALSVLRCGRTPDHHMPPT